MDAVEEVKSRLAIEDVIGEYVQLKRAGRNFKGLSPFSSEKSPSFIVSPEKQIWHDFSSGKGGNMFSFVMEMEGLDFRVCLELLARKAGVDLEQFGRRTGGDGKHRERLYEALEAAARFYQVQFSKNQAALEYIFKKRQFTKETVLEWRLGYGPNNGSALMEYLQSKKFTEHEIQGAGLSAKAYRGGTWDMFRGRIMIPLQDAQGRVIGFTARLLIDDKNAPKYINTPQTILYDKSRHVYGLHLAKEAIRKHKFVVLVEGNLDVIASHQAGIRQVVATAGTALTEQHLKVLSRFIGDIRLSFDADKAGLAATERAIPIASKTGVALSIIDIPSGKDPDELIKKNGVKAWQTIIESPKYALDWLIERYEKLLDVKSGQGKKQFSDVLLPVVQSLRDSVEKDHYLNKIAATIGVSREALSTKMNQTAAAAERPLKRRNVVVAVTDKVQAENTKVQDHFLCLLLLHPPLRDQASFVEPDMLFADDSRDLLRFLREHPDYDGKPGKQAAALQGVGDYVKILVLEYEELYQGLELTELRYEVTRLQARLVENFVKTTKQKIVAELGQVDDAAAQTLLEQVRQLDALLNKVKGGLSG